MAYNPDEALKLDNQLCFPLYAASRNVINLYTPYLKPLGITYTQYIVFLVLWEKDGLTMGELGQKLYLDNGTLTPLIKKMEKEGYVIRKRDQADERKVTIHLTKAGKEFKEKVKDLPQKIGSCISLPKEDALTLYKILYQILDGAE